MWELLIPAEQVIKSGNKTAAEDRNQHVPAFGEPYLFLIQVHSEEKCVLSPGKYVALTLTLLLS